MTPRQASRAADIFTGLVVASVALALAGLTWHIFGAGPASAPPPAGQAAVTAPPADIAPVLALAPFGPLDSASAQPTSLALQLRGIILADPSAASTALIAPNGGQPVAYKVGQAVPGGATIEEIALSRVLLRVNGRLERLDLPRVSAAGTTTSPQAAAPPPSNSPPAPPSPDGSPPPAMQAIAPPPAAPEGGPLALLEKLGAAPDGGTYKVGPEPSPAARRAGLLPGDVIERINGLPATAVVSDRQLIAAAVAAGPAQIDVLRGGKRISFSFALR